MFRAIRKLLVFLDGMILGAVVGAVIGILLAPQPGPESQEQLRKAAADFREEIDARARQARQRAEQLAEETRLRAEELQAEGRRRGKEEREVLEAAVSAARERLVRPAAPAGEPNVWVSPREAGRWEVKREHASRATRLFDRKGEAVEFARALAERNGVELIIQRRDGTIQERSSYGNDPHPPAG